ncbi:MAG: replication-associated recombination protein A [Vampirovibrio sp.]|nr:replication-associated recombination protein A [Vampirovibrio sp.]
MKKNASSSSALLELLEEKQRSIPLADALRPNTLMDFIGQTQVVGEGAPLRNLIESKELTNLMFWGPPGVGKTTLARIIASNSNANIIELSAVNSGTKELREGVSQAKEALQLSGTPTVVFIDEIHRYSKTQQDALLPYVEDGTITLMGATTENPSFQVIPALLSRTLIIRLRYLEREQMKTLIERGIAYLDQADLDEVAIGFLQDYANGDGRSALVLLEAAYKCAPVEGNRRKISVALLEQLAQQNRLNYDRQGDEHYDHASAYQKSMRGCDPDAALYWLAKMIAGGEDPRFIARRLVVCASEDVGLAHPMALVMANQAAEAVERLGMPEGRIPLAQATVYVAKAPKSNKAYKALDKALADIQKGGKSFPVPKHLRDAHYSDAKKRYGHGVGYIYTHDHPDTPQQFLPDALVGTKYLEE